MGKMSYDEYEAYYKEYTDLGAVPYYVEVFHDKKKGLSDQDVTAIEQMLERRQKKKYPYCSYQMVVSTTSKKCSRRKIYTGKPGRPKEVPIGRKRPKHTHIIVIGNSEHSAYSFGKDVAAAIDKRLRKRGLSGKRARIQQFKSRENAVNYINYSRRQADSVSTGGNFDFEKYKGFK